MKDYLKNQSPAIQRRQQRFLSSPSVPTNRHKNREKESSFESAGRIKELLAMPPKTDTNDTNHDNCILHTAHSAGAFSIDHQRQHSECSRATILDNGNDNDNSNENPDDVGTEDRDRGRKSLDHETTPLATECF
mmetsp:Transcript_51167/g.55414  ORF Transcript_51167/g.55414 Transcript_51167/m.55414 type:complete len:134 (+) Transcript_51167:112-513(+)